MDNTKVKNRFITEFEKNKEQILVNTNDVMKERQLQAFEQFKKLDIPSKKDENWQHTDVAKQIEANFAHHFTSPKLDFELEDIFKCDVPDLHTYTIKTINGWYPKDIEQIEISPEGVIMGSFAEAQRLYPELVEKYYAKSSAKSNDSLTALNTSFARDGIFIYIPDNVVLEKPIQIINIIYSTDDLIIQPRNLFIAGKNSEAKIVICEHSLYFNKSFVNAVIETHTEENARLHVYQVQNFNNNTALNSALYANLETRSVFTSNILSLHGGFIRNNTYVNMNAEHCESNLYGLYLADRDQHVDNYTLINHAYPNCVSNEKYKGLMDERGVGVFNGKVLVQKDAQKTKAYQSNNNILLTDKAKAFSRPQLEIYADDVKCSHGSTTGQLDKNALFYLRSRGIPEPEARMLLMYAFAAEIINKISVEPLRENINEMVERRLRGEMSRCNHCKVSCH